MHIYHIISLSYNNSNGIKTVLQALIPELEKMGHIVTVINTEYNKEKIFSRDYYLKDISSFVKLLCKDIPDLVVFNGNYNILFYRYAATVRKKAIPYLIVPHGGTGHANMRKSRWVKMVVNVLFTNSFIKRSNGIIFLNRQELDDSIYKHSVKHYIIPNGVRPTSWDVNQKNMKGAIHFVYLSRIDLMHKGLDVLLEGIDLFFKQNPKCNCDFHFYGGRFDQRIIDDFKKRISKITAPVFYHGEVFGVGKSNALLNANVYMLTSRYEGMPLTVLEALSFGNPCIITPQTNMVDIIEKNNAGWITEPSPESICRTLTTALREYNNDKLGYILRAKESVKSYEWGKIAKDTIQVYKSLIKK